jgi:hypothetical protein
VVTSLVSLDTGSGRLPRMANPGTTEELEDGRPAEPPSFHSLPGTSWNAGDTIPLGSQRALRVISKRLDENLDGDPVPTLVVEEAD